MQDPNHNNLIRPSKIVDRILLAERHAEIVGKLSCREVPDSGSLNSWLNRASNRWSHFAATASEASPAR